MEQARSWRPSWCPARGEGPRRCPRGGGVPRTLPPPAAHPPPAGAVCSAGMGGDSWCPGRHGWLYITCHLAWEPAPPTCSLGKARPAQGVQTGSLANSSKTGPDPAPLCRWGHREGHSWSLVPNPQAQGREGQEWAHPPGADDILMQAALTALALGPEACKALLQGIQVGYLGVAGVSGHRAAGAQPQPRAQPTSSHSPPSGTAPTPEIGRTCTRLLGAVSTGALGLSQPATLPCPFPARCPSRL